MISEGDYRTTKVSGRKTAYFTWPDTVGSPFHFVAVGTPIARRPPHRSVRARSRIRLLLLMHGGETRIGIRMQNTGLRNPSVQERMETIPSHSCALTATD